jgi:ketosteroid isomerase-like protein
MMSADAVARDFFDRLSGSDVSGALELLSDDVTWWLAGKPDEMRFGGTYTKERLERLLRGMLSRLPGGMRMTVRSTITDGDRVAVEVTSDGILDNGRSYQNEYCFTMRVAEGRITDVREYNDTLHAHMVWTAP